MELPSSPDAPVLVHGDCLEALRRLPAASVDVVITDPPAGVGFMGRTWDSFAGYEPVTERGREVDAALALMRMAPWARGFVVFMVDVWTEVDRVLKPGGIVCAWALPKTADLAGLAMRLVGWTPVDSLLHLFGCLSDDAEILTELGWVHGQNVGEARLALCYDVDRGTYQWMPIQRRVRFPYAGQACRVIGDGTDHIVTPDHRCVDDRFGFIKARSATEGGLHVPVPEGLRGLWIDVAGDDVGASATGQDMRTPVRERVDSEGEHGEEDSAKALRDLRRALLAQEPDPEPSVLLAPLLRAMEGERPWHPRAVETEVCEGASSVDRGKPGQLSGQDDGPEQPRVEGRRLLPAGQRELCRPPMGSMSAGLQRYGAQGRLCDGAPPCHRASVGQDSDPKGGCSSHEPRSEGQPADQSRFVQLPVGPQAVRSARGTSACVARVERVDYDGVMWCVTVPTGAFVARSNGMPFVTGNSGMSKNGDLGKKVDAMMGLEREVVGSKAGLPGYSLAESKGATVYQGGIGGSGDPAAECSVTAPASELAALWTGTSTQLSPGWEQWQIAVKSVDAITPAQLREIIGDHMWTYRKLDTPAKRKAAAAKWGREIPDGAREWRARPLAPEVDGRLELRVNGEVVATMPGPAYSKAPIRSAVANLLVHGCGAFNVDACRIPTDDNLARNHGTAAFGVMSDDSWMADGGSRSEGHPGGRLPKNVALTTGGPDCPAAELDRQVIGQRASLRSGSGNRGQSVNQNQATYGEHRHAGQACAAYDDSGGASRFFTRLDSRIGYHPKVSDRSAGLRSDIRNGHPTVKSEALADWLVRLLARPGCVMLDPFMGSGTFGVSAVRARVRFIGIERDPVTAECHDSFGVARARIMAAIGSPDVAAEANEQAPVGAQLGLL